ncbi:hypothetical protein DFQ30_000860 [Apophysomyces sp. BC1015]|nr:hypothetical protein DFQ30_000860 [Apophysomyces sp. BC1015]
MVLAHLSLLEEEKDTVLKKEESAVEYVPVFALSLSSNKLTCTKYLSMQITLLVNFRQETGPTTAQAATQAGMKFSLPDKDCSQYEHYENKLARAEPMDYIVDEEQYRLESLSSYTQYLSTLSQQEGDETDAMQTENNVKAETDVVMRESSIKRNYTLYTDQDKVRFFKLLFEKCLDASFAAKQLGIHERDPDGIFEKNKTGRPRLLDENPSAVLEQVMEKLRQAFTGLKVFKITLHEFIKKHCNLSPKKAQFQLIDKNSEEKIKECLDWIRKWEKTNMDFTRNCILLDESAFHISMKRSMAWSKKDSPVVVKEGLTCGGQSAQDTSTDNHHLECNFCCRRDS